MILIPHLVVSGVIATKVSFLPLALVLAFLSHYLLDFLPHKEYFIEEIEAKKWGQSKSDFIKIGIDFLIGLLFIILIHQIKGTDYCILAPVCFCGILPDLINFLFFLYPNNKFLKWHNDLHGKIHIFKENHPSHKASAGQRKISDKWRIFIQAAVVLLALAFLI